MAVVAGMAKAAFRAALPSYIKSGLSGAASYRKFKLLDAGRLRKQVYQGIFREVSGIQKMEKVFRFIRKDRSPDIGSFVRTAKKMDTKFLYKLEYDVLDDEGVFIEKGYTSLSSNTLHKAGDLAREGEVNMADESPDRYTPNLANFKLIEGFKSKEV